MKDESMMVDEEEVRDDEELVKRIVEEEKSRDLNKKKTNCRSSNNRGTGF